MTHALCLLAVLTAVTPVNSKKSAGLPAEARQNLKEHGFTVVEGREDHFFALYDRNAYQGIPNFITLDAVLHIFHVRFDDLLSDLEVAHALPALRSFAQAQRDAALTQLAAHPSDARWRRLALYHSVPLAMLDAKAVVPPSIADDVRAELETLRSASGLVTSRICPRGLDGTRFKPRGHYTQYDLNGYFRAVTFYSECAFPLDDDAALRTAVDVVRLVDAPSAAHLNIVTSIMTELTGPADDPGYLQLRALIPSSPELSSGEMTTLVSKVRQLPAGSVVDQRTPGEAPVRVFRLLGGAATVDSVVFSRGTNAEQRPFPSSLDVLGGLGSKEALELNKAPVPRLDLERKDFYTRWLAVLRMVVTPAGGAPPPFMQGPEWGRHTMVTAAGSWAELRHDSLLYVKQPLVMMQGGHSDELPASQAGGYVEPRPDIYRALIEMVQALEGRVPKSEALQELRGMLTFLVEVSELELAGKPFPKAVDQRLRQIGTELEALTRGRGDRLPDQPLIVDVHTVADERGVRALHAGVGRVDEIWVVVPRGKQWVLTRGGVFSYYEFIGDVGQRLDDQEWGAMLHEGKAPPRPAWAMPVIRPRTRAKN